jgi:hypothetical protein
VKIKLIGPKLIIKEFRNSKDGIRTKTQQYEFKNKQIIIGLINQFN